ncbi:MAG: DUF3006 domain-containing protein [Nitrososphaerota archaeon]|jgi:hydrogenase maturation factor|nr:DUF3006 domain-containing protein [Nitrososphaerota archaeon]
MIIVDRLENGIAVCEIEGIMTNVSLTKISKGVREGDVLIDMGEGSFYTIDVAKTAQRKADIAKRFERLKARSKK